MTPTTTTATLLCLPRHVLVHSILLAFLSARDCRALLSASRELSLVLGGEDDLWRTLLERRRLSWWTTRPRFPGAGCWKDVYLRTLRFDILVLVKTLTRPEGPHLRLVLSRFTPLNALKREVRRRQLECDGVALEDFDLVDSLTNEAMDIAGNDSLPPEDLGRLLWLSRRREESVDVAPPPAPLNSSPGEQQPTRRRSHRDPWRRYVNQIPDGALLCQVLVDGNGDRVPDSVAECESVLRRLEGKSGGGEVGESLVDAVTHALERVHALVGPTGYKLWWRNHRVHPLLRLALSQSANVPALQRVRALLLFFKTACRTIFRKRFVMDVLVRTFLTSGFAMAFTRLCVLLFPTIWRTQVKNMFDADFDLVFAFRLVKDVASVAYEAFAPVLGLGVKVEILRVLAALTFTRESRLENAMVVALAGLAQTLARLGAGADMSQLQEVPQYVASSLLWAAFEARSEHALSVSLPVYLYALPLVACAVVLRLRMFLAQSYLQFFLQYS